MRTYKPHARVANRTSRRIDGVDGVPTTHTQRGWVHAWTVADGPTSAAPLPFAAKKSVPAAVAVSAMCAVVLIATVVALVVIVGDAPMALLLIGGALAFLMIWIVALMLPAALRSHR